MNATPESVSRRQFCASLGTGIVALSCTVGNSDLLARSEGAQLTARPKKPSKTTTPGTYTLWTGTPTSYLVVPDSYRSTQEMPLVVALHGAGIPASGPLDFLGPYAQSAGFVLLVPDSTGATWDAIRGAYGPDIVTIDRALAIAFDRCAIDPARISLEGFSDGASYALGVGIQNPQLFTHLVAFSPGFVTETQEQAQKPRIFVSHGREDPILPIDGASRRIVPALRAAGFTVDYHEFEGVHTVPPDIAQTAVAFIMDR